MNTIPSVVWRLRPGRAAYASAVALWIGMLLIAPNDATGADIDTDGDGLSDAYEDAHGLDKLNPADALGDSDSDGFSNWSELQAGTDPFSAASKPLTGNPSTIAAAVLPLSRSAQIDRTVTAFATILNANTVAATNCSIAPITPFFAGFYFYATDPTTNAITGERNAPVNIPPGGGASFVFALTPHEVTDSLDIKLRFDCDNTEPATVFTGINTLLLSAANVPPPDIVALAATGTGDGVLRIPDIANPGAFAVASVNVGASGSLTVDAVSSVAGVNLSLCETNPSTGVCINPTSPALTVDATINANATPTFSIFATAQQAVPLAAAASRITVRFKDAGGVVRGATGVAIEALAPAPPAPKLSELQATIFTPICAVCHSPRSRLTACRLPPVIRLSTSST